MSRLPRSTQGLTIQQVADRLVVNKMSVYRLIWNGEIKATNVSSNPKTKRLRIADHEFERFMKAREQEVAA